MGILSLAPAPFNKWGLLSPSPWGSNQFHTHPHHPLWWGVFLLFLLLRYSSSKGLYSLQMMFSLRVGQSESKGDCGPVWFGFGDKFHPNQTNQFTLNINQLVLYFYRNRTDFIQFGLVRLFGFQAKVKHKQE